MNMDDIVADIIKEVSFVDTTVDLNETDLTPIQEFYRGSSVFVTGGTGFLGQLLIEKLLRSTPVSKIFVLIRSKKGKTVEARLAELLDGSLFQRLQKQTPAWRDKVVPVAGDCSLPDLNLRDQDKKLLTAEVDIIFHVAATVRFDEKLKMATFINVRATRDMLRLARQIPHLKSFVHVSTLYSNCNEDVVLEKVYPPAVSYETLIQMADGLDDKTLEKVTPSLLNQHPNTYVFTKQIAEDVVKEEGLGLPMAIHRPSVVTSTYREPVRAWVDTMYGATGITVGAYLGVLRVLHCDSGNNANLVPADMCVNSMIATAWEVGVDFEKAREGYVKYDVPVYNFESSNDQPIAWSECNHLLVKYIPLTPSNKSMWYICFSFVKFYPLYLVHVLLLHTVPGIIVDGLLLCTGKPPQMTKIYRKMQKFSSLISYFVIKKMTFKSESYRKLSERMSERDRKIFFSDLKELDWHEFIKYYLAGGRLHLLKESFNTLPEASAKYRRLYWAHQLTKGAVMVLLLLVIKILFSLCYSVE